MKKILKLWWTIPVFIATLSIYITIWISDSYDNPSFDQILFHITEPIAGVDSAIVYDFLGKCLGLSIIVSIVISIAFGFLMLALHNDKKIKIMKISISTLSIAIICICLHILGLFEYIIVGNKESTFIEDNYVDPQTTEIDFPEEKRNLIYIYVESLESTYLSVEEGGTQEDNLMPELTTLAKENISFSDTEKIGGAYQLHGTSWTTAALISHTAGVPLKLGKNLTNNEEMSEILTGSYTLGDILFREDYNQMIMFGSGGEFGNRELYFTTHGFYDVYDYFHAIDIGKIPSDYYVWWGFEDSKLFEYAKEEVTKLSQEEEPFNLTLLTVNTHQVDGYLEDSCKEQYDSQYANVISCTSYQVNEFINWCKEQDFYEDTTIIITGDHLSMDPNFFDSSEEDERRVFNTIINSAVEPVTTTNREFSTMDMFPTTLAALGATIEGDKLGLGTNLFSDEETLIEEYGFEEVNEEIAYYSEFYNEEILGIE